MERKILVSNDTDRHPHGRNTFPSTHYTDARLHGWPIPRAKVAAPRHKKFDQFKKRQSSPLWQMSRALVRAICVFANETPHNLNANDRFQNQKRFSIFPFRCTCASLTHPAHSESKIKWAESA